MNDLYVANVEAAIAARLQNLDQLRAIHASGGLSPGGFNQAAWTELEEIRRIVIAAMARARG